MKLIVGTAQFGLAYGAFNTTGQVSSEDVQRMLDTAANSSVSMLDTARAYGQAEMALRLAGAPARFNIISKCPDLRAEPDPALALTSAFNASCAALGVERMYGYLLHNADDLRRPGVWKVLEGLRYEGKVDRIGISGYDANKVAELCRSFPLTLVQLPANVLYPWYQSISFPESVEVHARSAFLQGFLLSDPAKLPEHLIPFRPVLEQFLKQAKAQDLTPVQAALAPLLTSSRVARVVVGADNLSQLEETLLAPQALADRTAPTFGPFNGVTPFLTDPRRWFS